jgi:hypothetical protein
MIISNSIAKYDLLHQLEVSRSYNYVVSSNKDTNDRHRILSYVLMRDRIEFAYVDGLYSIR